MTRDPLKSLKIFRKKFSNAKKLKGDPSGFFNIHSIAKHQKMKCRPFGEKKIEKKAHSAERNCKGTLRPRSLLYVTLKKKEQHFLLTSLSQMVQFDSFKYRRTFNYFD